MMCLSPSLPWRQAHAQIHMARLHPLWATTILEPGALLQPIHAGPPVGPNVYM